MEDRRGHMQIGEVAERTGLTQRAIRFYEEKGLLSPAGRMEGRFRLYTEEDIQRIEHIKQLKALLGFSLAEIKEMIEAEEIKNQLRAEYHQETDVTKKNQKVARAIAITESQARLIEQKIEQLERMRKAWEEKLDHYRQLLRDLEQETSA